MADIISEIISQLKSYHPEKVILFGSYAYGKPSKDSDIDLLIIKNTKKKYLDRVREVALMLDSKFPTDIFVLTPEELEKAISENRFMIIDEILPKGKVLFQASENPRHKSGDELEGRKAESDSAKRRKREPQKNRGDLYEKA